ncbi:MAG: hypothetical protein ACXWWC_05800 [Chitinophagaceae bacterium]
MNTSNKILTGFLIVIFLVPVIILLSFKSRIKSSHYTVVKNEQYMGADFRSGSFKPYKVVRLVAPPGRALKCNLVYSDSLYYSYTINDARDSISVYNLADTLFIQYISMTYGKDKTGVYPDNDLSVDVKLPSIERLIVNNAEATIQSKKFMENNNCLVELYGTGILSVGEAGEDNKDTAENKVPFAIDQLSIMSTNGEVVFGSNVNIRQLILHAKGSSVVTIKEGAAFSDVQGSLSDSSIVNASWKYVKKLAALNKNP